MERVRHISPEDLRASYDYAVLIPYGSNIKQHDSRLKSVERPDFRLTTFTNFVTTAGAFLYHHKTVKNLVLVGEMPFGDDFPSTSDLMEKRLESLAVPLEAITQVQYQGNMNTPFQIEAVARHQKEVGSDKPFLVVDWQYHNERVENHLKAYGVNADTVEVLEVLDGLIATFDLEKMREVFSAPLERLNKNEALLRRLSRYDKKGLVTKFLSGIIGSRLIDIVNISERDSAGKRVESPKFDIQITTAREVLKKAA